MQQHPCFSVYRLTFAALVRTSFGLSISHVLVFCLSAPRWNHQKHPRGSGDVNFWPLVLSAGCHRLGYEGSRDPHRISERGKHVMLHLSNCLNLINQSHSVRCKRCWKYVSCFISSSLFTGCYLLCFFLQNNNLLCLFHLFIITLLCCSLCCCCMPSALLNK